MHELHGKTLMAHQRTRTDENLPDVHIRVVPLDEELENVGVEPHGRQVDHVHAALVLPQYNCTQVYEAFECRKCTCTGSEKQW